MYICSCSHITCIVLIINAAYRSHVSASGGFENEYEEELHFDCGDKDALSYIKSRFSNSKKDRQFKFECSKVGDLRKCEHFREVNKLGKAFFFMCPINHVMTGVHSTFDKSKGDRVWDYECCQLEMAFTRICGATDYLNDFQEDFKFQAGEKRIFVGVYSHFDSNKA